MNPRSARCACSVVAFALCVIAAFSIHPSAGYADDVGRPAFAPPPSGRDLLPPDGADAKAQPIGDDRAILIIIQEPDCPTGNGWFSNVNSTIFSPYLARDDFHFTANGYVRSIHAWGFLFDGVEFCGPSNIESFRVRVYEKVMGGDCGCGAGVLAGERIIPLAATNPTLECVGGLFDQPVYEFSFDLNDDPFVLFGGEYILEVAANLVDPADCVFLWAESVANADCIGHTVNRDTGECAQPGAGDTAWTVVIESVSNDNCAFATPIPSVPFTAVFDNTIATNSGGPEGSCNSVAADGMDNDVWYRWTPDQDCTATLVVDHVDYDGLTAVYLGPDCGNLVEIACGDEPQPYELTFPVVAGQTYVFQVGDWGSFDGGGETIFSLGCDGPPMCPATLLVSAGGPDNSAFGPCNLYRVNADTGVSTLVGPIGFDGVRALDFAPDGTLYATSTDGASAFLLTIDPATGAGSLVGEISNSSHPNGFYQVCDISFDETGALFGYADGGPGGDALYRIDPATAEPTAIDFSGFAGGGNGIAFDRYGRLYLTPSDTNCLALLDRATAEGRCIPGSDGEVPTYVTSLDLCRSTGALYGAQPEAWSADSEIVILDPESGVVLRRVPTIDNIAGLCFDETGPPTNCDGHVALVYDNGAPDLRSGVVSIIDGPFVGDPPVQSADDFAVFGNAVINDVHWITIEDTANPVAWTGKVLVEIYQATGCIPPETPVVSRTVPDDGGLVTRTNLGSFPGLIGFDGWRYDVSGLDIGITPGHYFISLAPIAVPNAGGASYWATARGFNPADDLIGCESILRGESFDYATWTPYEFNDYDFAFQLTTCANCPGDLTGDNAVNADDLFQLLGAWGPCPGCPEDLTGDNQVNADDLFQLLGAWGEC